MTVLADVRFLPPRGAHDRSCEHTTALRNEVASSQAIQESLLAYSFQEVAILDPANYVVGRIYATATKYIAA